VRQDDGHAPVKRQRLSLSGLDFHGHFGKEAGMTSNMLLVRCR
tara:strand:+ start:67100 stop:67228 length:129 start_codon:yes stop_codon:yes gene_type:complete